MDSAVTLSWLEMRRLSGVRVRVDQDSRVLMLASENARLKQENERLLQRAGDLAASADTWIRLYESALARANEAGRSALSSERTNRRRRRRSPAQVPIPSAKGDVVLVRGDR